MQPYLQQRQKNLFLRQVQATEDGDSLPDPNTEETANIEASGEPLPSVLRLALAKVATVRTFGLICQ